MYPLNDLFMSKGEDVDSELRKRSQAELDVANAKPARLREPLGS
jgi:hypothetical protein